MKMLLVTLLISFVILLIWYIIRYVRGVCRMERSVKELKTLKPWIPIVRNATFFMGKRLEDVIQEFIKIIEVDGTPLKAQIGPAIFVMLDNPQEIQSVLMSTSCLDKPYIYDFLNNEFGLLAQRCNMKKFT